MDTRGKGHMMKQIQIRKECELELVTAPVASGRVIANINIRKGVSGKHYALASDGRAAVISECGPNTEADGELYIAANKYAAIRRAKQSKREKIMGHKALEVVEVLVGDSVKQMIQRDGDLIDPAPVGMKGVPMPDIHHVFKTESHVPCVTLNPSLLYNRSRAMGSKSCVTLAIGTDRNNPILVMPDCAASHSVGLLMPVRNTEASRSMDVAIALIKAAAPEPKPEPAPIAPVAEGDKITVN